MPDNVTEDPKDLRRQLTRALAERDEARGDLTSERTRRLVSEANLGYLNDHQRTALIAQVGDAELNLKAVEKAAGELGYEPRQVVPQGQPQGQPQPIPGQMPQMPGQLIQQVPNPQLPNGQPDPNADPNSIPPQMPPPFQPPMPPINPYAQQFVPQGVPMTDPNSGLPIDPATGQPIYSPAYQPPTQFVPGQVPQVPGQYPGQTPMPQNPGYNQYGQPQWNPAIEGAMQGMGAAERLQAYQNHQAQTHAAQFEAAINSAQTPEQVMAVVRGMGQSQGLVDADLLE